ncbi:myotubularin-related protein 9 isoform X1 [Polypterus senegalus]|uniref:myotubularin-related protein 9 isoform X1 n=1 Tax=Polypterus senegalus TaxID=55291 RepID=UPI0019662036|nr:myotubularin-related protein 9 isoform X1 [Polypterus senegalus]
MEFSEHIKTSYVDNVVLSRPFRPPVKGTLCVTSHHLLLSSRQEREQDADLDPDEKDGDTLELLLLLKGIDAVEKSVENLVSYSSRPFRRSSQSDRSTGSYGTITIKCKDLCIFQLEIPGMTECLNIASSIEALSALDSVTELYPFFYRPETMKIEKKIPEGSSEEFFGQIAHQADKWRLSSVNKDFSVCPTYPEAVIVPKQTSDEMLMAAAKFRQGGRFPVLSYYHKTTGKVIMRSSQPLVGAQKKRCQEDEELLGEVLNNSERGFIVDTRSAQLAQQARITGGGFESKSNYHNWKRLHRNMERGKNLQESLIKLVDACNDQTHNMDRWLSKLENSKWLSHVQSTLSTACLVAECVEREGCPVLVHGSDGTDTTLLVTSLAQLVLDPECRTLIGFQTLICREWIQAGHPFQQRCTHLALSHARLRNEAPIFLLFLDCCWQLHHQFPLAFQFSETLLIQLAQEAYFSNFGTFLCDTEKDRHAFQVKEKTFSFWDWMNNPAVLKTFTNPLYQRNELVIWPSVWPHSLHLWQGFFFRWISCSKFVEEAQEEIQRIMRHYSSCISKLNKKAVLS